MAEAYRYNVIIEVGVDPSNFQQGKEQVKAQLRSWENEVVSSQKRVQDQTKAQLSETVAFENQYNQQRANQSRTFHQQRFNEMKEATQKELVYAKELERDLIAQEISKNQSIISERRSYNQQRFNELRETTQQEVAYARELDKDLFAQEISKNQSIISEKRTYHQQRFNEMRNGSEKESIFQKEALKAIELNETQSYANRLALHESFLASLNRQTNTASQQTQARSGLAGQGTVTGAFSPSNINGNAIPMPSTPLPSRVNLAAQIDANKQALTRTFADKQLQDAAKNIENITGKNILLNDTVKKGAKSWGMWGQAFKGAFIGATAGIAFSTILSGISNIAHGIVDFVKTSVEMAGKLEQTTNALTVFTGSANIARQELADLDEVARTTTGLSLPSAREGYQELRALNFEASLSRNLIAGIGKERLLSGADEQSVQRVVTNLVQLSAGSSRASQDVKEMIHAIPRLGLEFQKAYGTLDFKEIGQQFKNDPDKALRKLADAMNEAKGASGGFLDAQMKLGDEIQRVQEKAGQPLMKALTSDIIYLTQAIHDNESMFIRWGIQIENTYAGLSKIGSWIAKYNTISMIGGEGLAGSFINKFLINGGVTNIAEAIGENRNHTAIQAENTYDQVRIATINAQIANQRKAEQQEAARLAMAKGNYATTQAGIKDQFRLAQARLDNADRISPQDEMAYVRASSQLKASQYAMEYQKAKEHYNQMFELNKGKDEELYKLNEELVRDTQKFNTETIINELETQTKLREIKKKAIIQDRQDLLEANSLTLQEWQQGLDKRTFELEQQLNRSITLNDKTFQQLINTTTSGYDEMIQLNRDALNLQLENETLNDQQRLNLKKKSFLEEEKLAEEKNRKILDIEDKEHQRRISFITQASNRTSGLLQSANQGGSFSDFFTADSYTASSTNAILKTMREDIETKKEIADNNKQRILNSLKGVRENEQQAFDKNLPLSQDLQASRESLTIEQNRANAEIGYLNNKYSLLSKIQTLANARNRSMEDYEGQALADKHGAELNQLGAELKLKQQLLAEELKYKYTDQARVIELQYEIRLLKEKGDTLSVNQEIEDEAYRRSTRQGLRQTFGQIQRGETRADIYESTEKTLLKQRNATLTEGIAIEQTLGDITILNLTKQIEAQGTYNELLQKELDATKSQVKSQILIADQMVYHKNQADASVLEYVASQKGLTDIISDAKINLMTNAFSALDNVIQKMTRSFGFASDAVSQFLSGIIKLSLNRLFLKMFGVDLNGNSKSGFTATADGGAFGGGGGAGGNGGVADVISQALHGRGASGTSSNPLALLHGLGGFGTPNGMPSTGSTMLGASGEQAFSVNGSELLGAGASSGNSSLAGAGASTGRLGSLGLMLPFLGGALGSKLGGASATGRILGLLGGVAGGVAGLGLTGGLTGLLGIGGALTATAIALPLAPLLLVGAYFLGRNAKRRKEETQRDKAMVDAFASLDKLISDVQSDKIDGVSALSQADQIRTSYLDEMGKLKDDKTRRIALADVSRIDAKISLLKSAVSSQQRRQDRLTQLVPTFFDGGNVSNFIGSNYANNPLGYQTGRNKVGWFENAQTFAQYNELGNEYIFDHQTTRNIGVRDLDTIRATKGASYLAMKQRFSPKAMMSGGEVSSVPSISSFAPSASSNTSSGNGKTELHANFQIGLAESTFVEVLSAWIANEGGQEMLDVISNIAQNQSNNKLTQVIVDSLRQRGLV